MCSFHIPFMSVNGGTELNCYLELNTKHLIINNNNNNQPLTFDYDKSIIKIIE